MSNTVALTLIIVGVVGVCGSVFLLVVLAVVWWFTSRTSQRDAPTTVVVHVDKEELILFRDYDTGRSQVARYELFDERVELEPEKPAPKVLQIRPRPGLIAPAMPLEETASDPETDSPLAFGEDET